MDDNEMKGKRLIASSQWLTQLLMMIFPVVALLLTIYEILAEQQWMDKLDDIIIFGLMVIAIALFWIKHKHIPRYIPLMYLVLALITKVGAFFIEQDKPREIFFDIVIAGIILLGIIVNSYVLVSPFQSNVNIL
jgi:hypothetical protein